MVFGILIDVPSIVGGFLIMFRYRKLLAQKLVKVPIPAIVTSLLLSVPLIIFEEDIDCMPAWCGKVWIPPTLPFILLEIFMLCILSLRFHWQNEKRVVFGFTVFGVFWEIFLGGLVGAPLIVILLLGPYVMVGYGFVSLLPLTVLLEKKKTVISEEVHVEEPIATVPMQS